MSFQKEFKYLRDSYESTVLKNPVLSKEQEQFIFAKIQTLKDRIFQVCLKDENVFDSFIETVKTLNGKGNSHEVFMVDAFESELEYDAKVLHDTTLALKLPELTRVEALLAMKKHHITHDLYLDAFEMWKSVHRSKIVDAFDKDLSYCINKVLCSNLKIIIQIVSSYRNSEELTVSDLFSEGIFGLRRAICLFNYNLGHKFSTYASQWIKSAIGRAISDKGSLIRIPVNIHEQRREVEKLKRTMRKELGRDPEECEIMSRMRKKVTSLSALETTFSYYQIDNSKQDMEFSGGIGVCLEDNLHDEKILDESEIMIIKKARNIIEEYVQSVRNEKERYYLIYHFGLNEGNEVKTKEEIIQDLAINRKEYDTIRKKAIINLRKALAREKAAIEAFDVAAGWEFNSNLEYV